MRNPASKDAKSCKLTALPPLSSDPPAHQVSTTDSNSARVPALQLEKVTAKSRRFFTGAFLDAKTVTAIERPGQQLHVGL
jgi:hypothetical protein